MTRPRTTFNLAMDWARVRFSVPGTSARSQDLAREIFEQNLPFSFACLGSALRALVAEGFLTKGRKGTPFHRPAPDSPLEPVPVIEVQDDTTLGRLDRIEGKLDLLIGLLTPLSSVLVRDKIGDLDMRPLLLHDLGVSKVDLSPFPSRAALGLPPLPAPEGEAPVGEHALPKVAP